MRTVRKPHPIFILMMQMEEDYNSSDMELTVNIEAIVRMSMMRKATILDKGTMMRKAT